MEKKLIDYDGFEAYSKSVRKKYADKVDKVVGKQLSTNDYTNADKKKVDAIPDNPKYTDTTYDLSGYATKAEVVTSVNGKKGDMMVDFFVGDDTRDKNYAPKDYLEYGARYKSYTNSQFEFKRCTVVGVDRLITQDYCIVNTQVPWADKSGGLPMQVAYGKGVIAVRDAADEDTWGEWSTLSTSNDLSDYATKIEIQQMIEKASSLKKEVVTSLPQTGKDDVIYLVKDEKGKDNNNYLEYLWLNGKYELIGSTQVDLSGYMTKEEFQTWDDTNTMDMQEFGTEMATKLEKKIDKSQMASSISSPSNNQVLTTLGAKSQFDMLKSQLENLDNVLTKDIEKKLNKADIQEFTQKELEEAFK